MPSPTPDPDVTQLLDALRNGEAVDDAALLRALYDELHALARHHRARWRGNETLNTTALVHEAYLKLVGNKGAEFAGRAHFLATASKAMRHVLITYAERQAAQKRGGGQADLPLDEALLVAHEDAEELLALDEALARLELADPRAARIVECRFFGGLSAEETAQALDISTATVTRGWRAARAWLYGELRREPPALRE